MDLKALAEKCLGFWSLVPMTDITDVGPGVVIVVICGKFADFFLLLVLETAA